MCCSITFKNIKLDLCSIKLVLGFVDLLVSLSFWYLLMILSFFVFLVLSFVDLLVVLSFVYLLFTLMQCLRLLSLELAKNLYFVNLKSNFDLISL